MKELDGKVVLITGASSGIGWACAKLFASRGARLIVTARREERLKALVSEIEQEGGNALFLTGDVQQESHAKELVGLALSHYGRLDVAVNNAGTLGVSTSIPEMSLEQWSHTLATNLTSAFLGAKYQLPAMIEAGGGSLIFVSSFVGYTVGFPGMGAYAASKAGILGLVKVLATTWGSKNIRVNALLPGGTDTEMNVANAPGAGPEVAAYLNQIHALKRLAKPDELAQAALYLASDASSFVTGTSMLVDGGVSVTK